MLITIMANVGFNVPYTNYVSKCQLPPLFCCTVLITSSLESIPAQVLQSKLRRQFPVPDPHCIGYQLHRLRCCRNLQALPGVPGALRLAIFPGHHCFERLLSRWSASPMVL